MKKYEYQVNIYEYWMKNFDMTVLQCDEYNCQAKIWIKIYFGQTFLANTNMNIFGVTFIGKYEYEYIWIPFFRTIQFIWVYT